MSFDGILVIDYKDVIEESELGKGAFGTVYKATFEGKTVAVKRLDVSDNNDEVEFKEKFTEFRKEASLMAGLVHPNIVKLLGVSVKPFAMITEFLAYGDLCKFFCVLCF